MAAPRSLFNSRMRCPSARCHRSYFGLAAGIDSAVSRYAKSGWKAARPGGRREKVVGVCELGVLVVECLSSSTSQTVGTQPRCLACSTPGLLCGGM